MHQGVRYSAVPAFQAQSSGSEGSPKLVRFEIHRTCIRRDFFSEISERFIRERHTHGVENCG